MTKIIKNWRRLLLMLGALLCILTSCQPSEKVEVEPPQEEDVVAKSPTSPTTPIPTTNETTQQIGEPITIDKPIVLPPIIPDTAGGPKTFTPLPKPNTTNAANTTTNNTTTAPTAPSTQTNTTSNSVSNIYTTLQEYASQGQSYYIKNVNAEGLITRGGKLYNSKGVLINAAYLDSNTNVNSEYDNFGCDVLLVKGSDIAKFDGTQVPEENYGLNVFTAIKVANSNKILLACSTGSVGNITLENYRTLLRGYNQNHGEIGSPVAGSELYERILNFIRVHEGIYDNYFVREIKTDSKYAMVTLSPQSNTLDIKQYILVNDNSFWEVALSELEKEYNLVAKVNQALPDFNLGMLPIYNIASSKNNFKADNSAVFKIMITNNLIESTSQIYYACGTTDYCYIVLYDNQKYLAMRSGQNWRIESVSSSREALNWLQEDGGQATGFIVLDNDKPTN